jgi:hypothetical protein
VDNKAQTLPFAIRLTAARIKCCARAASLAIG